MTIVDWAGAKPGPVATLYAEETRYWREAFGWDTAEQWAHIETARTTWGLPGLLALDTNHRTSGWLYYLRTETAGVQLGGVTASDPATTQALISRLTAVENGRRLSAFTPAQAPGLVAAFEKTGWVVTPHVYLTRSLAEGVPIPDGPVRVRPWRGEDADLAAGLLQNAYADRDGRLFAPGGCAHEWRSYVRGLTEHTGCGRFLPGASGIALTDELAETPAGVVLTTAIADHTAHIAQIGVNRGMVPDGGGRSLLGFAMHRAVAAGHQTISLLVSATNARARRLYQAAGFTEQGRFLEAVRTPSRAATLSALPADEG